VSERTYFHDFTREDGLPVTVEYRMDGGTCASIIKCWPNTPEHEALNKELLELDFYMLQGRSIEALLRIFADDERKERIHELQQEIARDEERVELSDAERERMEAWLSENFIPETDDIEF
jgi:hypothetical protein